MDDTAFYYILSEIFHLCAAGYTEKIRKQQCFCVLVEKGQFLWCYRRLVLLTGFIYLYPFVSSPFLPWYDLWCNVLVISCANKWNRPSYEGVSKSSRTGRLEWTANGRALCHYVQFYRYFVSHSSEFYHHNPSYCFSTSVYCCCCCCCCWFRYWLSPETFGYTLAQSRFMSVPRIQFHEPVNICSLVRIHL